LTVIVDLENAEATERLGEDLARALIVGDVLALSGDLGAGKSTLARALIRAIADDPDLDVPSPTFTLAQTYQLRIPVTHFDLYRITSADELAELGLEEALTEGMALLEWPERAGARLKGHAVWLRLDEHGTGRVARIDGPPEVMERIERSFSIRSFLESNGLSDAQRRWYQGDASTRSFERITPRDSGRLILMDHPEKPDLSPVVNGRSYRQTARITWTVRPFSAIARALQSHGFAAPQIHAQDLDQGILLMEDLGDGKIVDSQGQPIEERYCLAAEFLAHLHDAGIGPDLPCADGSVYRLPLYDRDAFMIEARLLLDWYFPYSLGRQPTPTEAAKFEELWEVLIARMSTSQTGLVLRDFHSPNIIWRPSETGFSRIGLVDIQDAVQGPLSYDVSSLAQDARVSVSEELENKTIQAYALARRKLGEFDADSFSQAYAITALQRATKIAGIFVRLDRRDGKPSYLKHLPRIENYIRRTIHHPALADLADFYSSFDLT
jgi:N-acetylmuramate 1-kinase